MPVHTFANVKFTAQERRAIEAGWHRLEDVAERLGHTGRAYLAQALKLETTGSQAVPRLFAKGMLCGWFDQASAQTIAQLFGDREASILLSILRAHSDASGKGATDVEREAIAWAAASKQAAFERRPS